MCKVRRTYRIFKHDAETLERLFSHPSKAVRVLISAYVRRAEMPTPDQISELVELRKELHKIGTNINQIARKLNADTRDFDSDALSDGMENLRDLVLEIRCFLRGFNGS